MSIRRFQEGDAAEVMEIHSLCVRTLGKYYSKKEIRSLISKDSDIRHWKGILCHTHSYVAEEGRKILGFGNLMTNGYIWMLYVRPDHYDEGIGSMLLTALEHDASEMGLHQLRVDSLLNAVGFYQKHGYVIRTQGKKDLWPTAIDTVTLEKKLSM